MFYAYVPGRPQQQRGLAFDSLFISVQNGTRHIIILRLKVIFVSFPWQSMFEVLTSEASYLRSLRVLTEHFQDSRDLEETMIIRDRKTLFSNILRVREVSER